MEFSDVKKQLDDLFASNLAIQKTSTKDVREVSAHVFRRLKKIDSTEILQICEQLLALNLWRYQVVAFDWAFRLRKSYKKETFEIFERWLFTYVSGWSDCDDFCTHAFGYFLLDFPEFAHSVESWATHPDFWVRRASAVIWIIPIKHKQVEAKIPIHFANLLFEDEHYLVLKGYGWMLKVLSTIDPQSVKDYVWSNRASMPRLALRYAIEKFDSQTRKNMMSRV